MGGDPCPALMEELDGFLAGTLLLPAWCPRNSGRGSKVQHLHRKQGTHKMGRATSLGAFRPFSTLFSSQPHCYLPRNQPLPVIEEHLASSVFQAQQMKC